MPFEMHTEEQSQFNAGLELAKDIQEHIRVANAASHVQNMNGIREWWLHLQDIDRCLYPRLRQAEHRKRLDEARVHTIPLDLKGNNQYSAISFYRRKLTAYQVELETLRDKLGLGFKPGDDPRGAILR